MSLNIATMFEAVAAAVPDRVALVCEDEKLTFAQLDERANRFGNFLVDQGLEPGDHIGIHMYNSNDWVAAFLGALKARVVPINVNFRYTGHELEYLFKDADLVAVLTSGEFAPVVADVAGRAEDLRLVIIAPDESGDGSTATFPDRITAVGLPDAYAAGATTAPRPERSGDDQIIIYTGGTTGMPKGVMWRQEDFHMAALSGANPYGEPFTSTEALVANATSADRMELMYSVSAPLMHGAALYSLLTALLGGQATAILPRFDPVEFLRMIEAQKVNIGMVVGDAIARPLVQAIADHPEIDLSSLFYLGSGGAIFSETVKAELRELMPNLMIGDNFGSSETGSDGSATLGEDGRLRVEPRAGIMVIDDNQQPVAPGSGELGFIARAGHVPLGYYNDEVKTARTFPVIDGVRWAVPGDLAEVLDDGVILVHGRGSQTINSGGEKVFPEEVETVLKAHPDIVDCLVAGVDDDTYGQRVGAVVTVRDPDTFDPEAVRTFLRESLAGYKVPARILVRDTIMRSPAGKADYRWAKRELQS